MLWLASSGGRGGGWLDTPRRDFASNYVIKTPPAALGGPLSTYLGLIRYRANWLPLLSARVSPPPSAPSPSPFLLPLSFLPRRERRTPSSVFAEISPRAENHGWNRHPLWRFSSFSLPEIKQTIQTTFSSLPLFDTYDNVAVLSSQLTYLLSPGREGGLTSRKRSNWNCVLGYLSFFSVAFVCATLFSKGRNARFARRGIKKNGRVVHPGFYPWSRHVACALWPRERSPR